jgi:hypothetical protein
MASSDSAIPVVLATAALCVVLAMMVGHVPNLNDTTHQSVAPVCSLSPWLTRCMRVRSRTAFMLPAHSTIWTSPGPASTRIDSWTTSPGCSPRGVFGNPHSKSASSRLSTGHVDDVRHKLYQYFRADPEEYVIVFTRSATGASDVARRSVPLFAKLNVRVHSFEP